MVLPAWNWPLSGAAARGAALVPFGAGIVVADWTAPVLWPFNGTAFTPPIVLASGTPGFSDMQSDGASGVWTVSYDGVLWHQPAAGSATATLLPSGSVYLGCAFAAGQPYVATAFGAVLTSGGTALGNWPVAATALTASGSTLLSLLTSLGVGSMTTAGVTGLIALPAGMGTASCLSAGASTPIAIAGWQTALPLAGAAAAALSPVDPTVMLAAGTGRAVLWRAPSPLTDAWSQSQVLTGLAALTGLAWAPDGFHALAVSPASGVVQVLSYATGAIALSQTLAVPGAASVAVAGDSLHALIAQPGLNQVMTLVNTGTWAAGTAVTGLAGSAAVIPYGASGAVAAYASGLAYLTLATGGWSVTARLPLGYVPSVLTQDPFGNVYAAGSGALSVVASGLTVAGSGAWAGAAPTGIALQQGRLLLAVPSDGYLYEFGQNSPGAWSVQTANALAAGTPAGLGLADTTLFVLGSGSTVTYGFSGSPFALTNPVSGSVAQRIGGAWVTTSLGVGATPSAIGYDLAGNLRVATTQNTLWTINQAGAVAASGIIPQYSGQPQSVPLGVSAMLAFASGMYLATSLPGTLIAVA